MPKLNLGDRVKCYPFGRMRIMRSSETEDTFQRLPPEYGVVLDFSENVRVVFVLRQDMGGGSSVYPCFIDNVEGPMSKEDFDKAHGELGAPQYEGLIRSLNGE